jgi:hypothetical protein
MINPIPLLIHGQKKITAVGTLLEPNEDVLYETIVVTVTGCGVAMHIGLASKYCQHEQNTTELLTFFNSIF